ncbi:MAG: HAD-IA family hydrolase [Pseudomonadota bacterium]
MITHVMLDVDGVLVSGHSNGEILWTSSLAQDLGIEPDNLVGEFFSKGWLDVVTGRERLEPVLQAALDRMGADLSAETLIAYWFENDERLVAAVIEDCQKLREAGLTILLATNQEHCRAAYLMQDLGLERVVDGIVYSAQAGAQKPARAFFDYAMGRTGAPAGAHLLVDDTLANVDAARRVGWHGHPWTGADRLWDVMNRYGAQ